MILNLTKNKPLSRRPVYARGVVTRGRGMIGRDFTDFDAMVFENCNTIHTLFMSIPIDVVFLDVENKVCEIREGVRPWVPFVRSPNAVSVIEIPEGNARRTSLEEGDAIDLNAEASGEKRGELAKEILGSAGTAIPLKSDRRET